MKIHSPVFRKVSCTSTNHMHCIDDLKNRDENIFWVCNIVHFYNDPASIHYVSNCYPIIQKIMNSSKQVSEFIDALQYILILDIQLGQIQNGQ